MRKYILFFGMALIISAKALAGPGDTITVQTFTFGSPQQNQWFVFPSDTISFEKILMYYKLKCNPAQSPACGEWDYLTYTHLFEHTGKMDSTLKNRSRYVINFSSPDTIRLSQSPSWQYQNSFEKKRIYTDTLSLDTFAIGSLVPYLGNTFPGSGMPGARVDFIYTAQELIAAGFSAGPISGLRLFIANTGANYERFRISIAATSSDSLSAALLFAAPFTTHYEALTSFPSTGWQSFAFITPFIWDGVSNVIFSYAFESHLGANAQFASHAAATGKALISSQADGLLEFEGSDLIALPMDSISSINQQITISFWRYGDPVLQPQSQSTFFGFDAQGNRLLNAHVPWSNGSVYWDAGWGSNNYDRINKAATAAQYKGSWSHWAFTKNTVSGSMKIYYNGQLWHSGTGMTRSMAGLVSFYLGGMPNLTADRFDDAMLDELAIWNIELSQAQIQDLMFRKPDTGLAFYPNLRAYYSFDEPSGSAVIDQTANSQGASLFGQAQRLSHDETLRYKDFQPCAYRPQMVLERGSFVSSLDSSFVMDSVMLGITTVLAYNDSTQPNTVSDTISAYLPYEIRHYDNQGNLLSSLMSTIDTVLINSKLYYYDPPFEVVNRYELGRFITPYGNNLSLGDGWTWVYDVSDFRLLLHDSVRLSAGNWQELLDMKFLMIEGTPPRNVVKIQNVWTGNFNLSNYDVAVPPKTLKLDPNSAMWRLKSCVTGHQFSNSTNCAEFCPKIHSVWVADTMRYSWQIVQSCADNPLYPQGGTWIHDRAGWCPGMEGAIYDSELTPFIHGDSAKIDYESQLDPYGNYVTEIQLISYSEPNHQLDAAISAIISPNKWELRSRLNPICSRPEVEISNLGASNLTSALIEYRFEGDTFYHYQWTGNLPFLAKQKIKLPAMDFGSLHAVNGRFEVRISNPNGGTDQYSHNNRMLAEFELSPVYNTPVIVWFKTNYFANENFYEVFDRNGNLVFSKGGLANNTLYKDTLWLPDGCYDFVLHDSDDDGISYWNNSDGAGYLRFYAVGGGLLKNFQPDFGEYTRFQFTYLDVVGVEEAPLTLSLTLGPNPCRGELKVLIPNEEPLDCRMDLYQTNGNHVWSKIFGPVAMETLELDFGSIAAGTYQLVTWLGSQRYVNQLIIQH